MMQVVTLMNTMVGSVSLQISWGRYVYFATINDGAVENDGPFENNKISFPTYW